MLRAERRNPKDPMEGNGSQSRKKFRSFDFVEITRRWQMTERCGHFLVISTDITQVVYRNTSMPSLLHSSMTQAPNLF
jgi:hypothetical protein